MLPSVRRCHTSKRSRIDHHRWYHHIVKMTHGWKDRVPTHPIDRQGGATSGHPPCRDNSNEEGGEGVGVEGRARKDGRPGSGDSCVGG